VVIGSLFARLPDGMTWRPLLTTEDAEFAVDPAPPTIASGAGDVSIHFQRPGAVIFAAEPPHTGGPS
jgi:hypothetical protein